MTRSDLAFVLNVVDVQIELARTQGGDPEVVRVRMDTLEEMKANIVLESEKKIKSDGDYMVIS